jgi:hypothetical protein
VIPHHSCCSTTRDRWLPSVCDALLLRRHLRRIDVRNRFIESPCPLFARHGASISALRARRPLPRGDALGRCHRSTRPVPPPRLLQSDGCPRQRRRRSARGERIGTDPAEGRPQLVHPSRGRGGRRGAITTIPSKRRRHLLDLAAVGSDQALDLVGKSQSVLIMINPIIFTWQRWARIRRLTLDAVANGGCANW